MTLEWSTRHAAVAEANLRQAGLSGRVDVVVGTAIDSLATLAGDEPFDLVFLDADKAGNPDYLEWALRLTRPGSVIVADNVVRGGEVLAERAEPRLAATAIQTVGSKGYDGFAIAVVIEPAT